MENIERNPNPPGWWFSQGLVHHHHLKLEFIFKPH
jgi:hypothetical protein